jgi:hypothetical protein
MAVANPYLPKLGELPGLILICPNSAVGPFGVTIRRYHSSLR